MTTLSKKSTKKTTNDQDLIQEVCILAEKIPQFRTQILLNAGDALVGIAKNKDFHQFLYRMDKINLALKDASHLANKSEVKQMQKDFRLLSQLIEPLLAMRTMKTHWDHLLATLDKKTEQNYKPRKISLNLSSLKKALATISGKNTAVMQLVADLPKNPLLGDRQHSPGILAVLQNLGEINCQQQTLKRSLSLNTCHPQLMSASQAIHKAAAKIAKQILSGIINSTQLTPPQKKQWILLMLNNNALTSEHQSLLLKNAKLLEGVTLKDITALQHTEHPNDTYHLMAAILYETGQLPRGSPPTFGHNKVVAEKAEVEKDTVKRSRKDDERAYEAQKFSHF